MNKRLLTDEEKKTDPRFPAVVKVFPEFDCYDDGTVEMVETPPGLAYIIKKNQDAIKEIKEIGIIEYLRKRKHTNEESNEKNP